MGCELCDKKSNIQDKNIDDSICTIRNNKGLYSLGLFCNIEKKHVLITNDDILWEDIDNKTKKKIILYKNEKVIDLIIDNSRIYINQKNGTILFFNDHILEIYIKKANYFFEGGN